MWSQSQEEKSIILLPEFKDLKFTIAEMCQTRERFWNPSHKQLAVKENGDTLKSFTCNLKLHKLLLMHLCSLKLNQNCRGITVGDCGCLADENYHAKLLLFPWY